MGNANLLFKLFGWTKPMVKITKRGLKIISENSNLVLTIVGATGAVASVAFAIHGTIKAVKLCEIKQPQGTKEVIKTVWKCYIPTIGIVILTTAAIIGNGRINAKKIAFLTSALAGSRNSLKILEQKMAEEIGPKKAQKVIDAANSEEAKQNIPTDPKEIIDTGKGDVLFFIKDFGQWIRSSHEGIELAEIKTREDLQYTNDWDENGDNYIPANTALKYLGARECGLGTFMGWKSSDFREENKKGPKFSISSEWMEVDGKKQIVGTVWFDPAPDYI